MKLITQREKGSDISILKRGRPMKRRDDRLCRKTNLRTTEFELEQAKMLAERQGISFNTYIRNLIIADYYAYRDEKTQDAASYDELYYSSKPN